MRQCVSVCVCVCGGGVLLSVDVFVYGGQGVKGRSTASSAQTQPPLLPPLLLTLPLLLLLSACSP